MFLIQNTLVSLDVLEKDFCCDLDKCRGCCCIEGDAGAPLEESELAELEKALPIVWDELSDATFAFTNTQIATKTLFEQFETNDCISYFYHVFIINN